MHITPHKQDPFGLVFDETGSRNGYIQFIILAGGIYIEQIMNKRTTIIYLGVSLMKTCHMIGDNESFVKVHQFPIKITQEAYQGKRSNICMCDTIQVPTM